MRSLLSLSFLFLLSFAAAAPVSSPDADADAIPTPTLSNRASNPRLFTVQAFESPDPSGVGLTAYYLGATKSGTIYLSATAPSPATVLYVDSGTRAYLNTNPPTPLYIDTSHGQLLAGTTLPNTALTVPFYHLGTGTTLYTPENGYVTEGSAVFQWIGSENDLWWACPLGKNGGGKLGIFKQMTVVNPDLNNCTGVELGAIDFGG